MTEELKQVSGESESVADTGVMDGAALQTDEDTVIEGSTGAVSVMGQVARLINPPPAGQTDVIRLAPGERFELATNPAAVNLAVDGDNLILGFDLDGNGTPDSFVILEDLVLAAGGGNPPVLMVAGEPIGVDLLIGNAQAFAQIDQGGPGTSLETAAGDTGPQGGGVTEYSDNLGDAIDLLVAQGVIPPVQLEFGLIELEDEILIVEGEDTPPETLPPGVPDTTFSFDETPGSGLSGFPFTGDGSVDGDVQGRGNIDGTSPAAPIFPESGSGAPNEISNGFLYTPFQVAMNSGGFGINPFTGLSGSGLHQVAAPNATSAELQYTTGAPVLTSGGDPVTSQGEQIYYLVDPTNPNLVLGVTNLVVSEDFRYDDLVFAIHLDDAFSLSGDNLAFTYAEYQQIDHPDSTDHDESIALTINFDVTGPGGTTSAKVTLLVEDDGPNADGGEGGSDDMLVYDETPGLQTGEETSDLLPVGLAAVVSDLLQTEEIEAVCGAARDTIFFDYGMDQPIEGGEGNFIGGVALTQADGSFYDGEDSELDTLDGDNILLFSDGGNVVYGKTAGGEFVFAVYLDDSSAFSFSGPDNDASADIWFVQFKPFFHPDGSDPNDEIQFSAHYTVTDFDQDTSTQEFIIKILDDGPSVLPYGESIGVVEEEHLPLGNEDEDDYLGLDGDSGGDLSITTTTAKGVLSVLVDPGKDAPALFGLASDTTPLQDQNLTSGGQPLSYAFSGGVLVGFIGADEADESNWIFTLDLQTDGSWTFTLLSKLDHHDISDADDVEDILTIDFTGMVEVTDSDFDPVTLDPGSFLVKVIDDIPIANDDEDNAAVGGSPVSGNVITGVNSDPDSPGADGLGVIRSLTHDGVTYELNEAGDSISDGTHESPTDGDDLSSFGFVFDPLTGVLTINTAEGGTFSVDLVGDAIGKYTYTPPASASGTTETFVYALEDGDGDSDTATLTIDLDGTPSAGPDQAITIDETSGHENEGASDISDDVNPDTITLNASTTTALASLGLATNLSDSLSVAQKDPIGFSYGADGKGVTGGISFDDPAGAGSGLVDTATGESIFLYLEDSLIVGRVGAGGVADESGDIAFVMILEENGTPDASTVDSSAEFLVVSYRAIKHDNPDDHDEENPEPGGFNDETVTVSFTVQDADGDQDSAEITVSFEDDGPDAVDDPSESVTEGDPEISGNVLANDDPGSDGGQMTHVRLPGGDFVAFGSGTEVASGEYQFIVAGVGTYTFKADGSWTFTPAASVDNSSGDVDASFDYRLTDGDGDTDEATQPISIEDGADPAAGGPLSLSVDEDDLPGGTDQQPEPGNDRIDEGTLGFTAGSDDLTSFAFSTDLSSLEVEVDGVAGDDVIWVRNNDTEIVGKIGGIDAIRLTLIAPSSIAAGAAGTVTVKVELLEAFPHPDANGQNIINLGSVNVVATDSDGDNAQGAVNIEVVDDVPTIGTPDHGVVANAQNTSVTGSLDLIIGADGLGTVSLLGNEGLSDVTSGGQPVTYVVDSSDPSLLIAHTGGDETDDSARVFTLKINDDGTYTFTLLKPIDAIETVSIGAATSFGSGPTGYQVLSETSESEGLAIISSSGGINGSTSGWGVDNNNFDTSEIIRVDFGAKEGSFPGPGDFSGPEVSGASVMLLKYSTGDKFQYTAHFVDADGVLSGSVTVDVLVSGGNNIDYPVDITAPDGLFLAYIEFKAVDVSGGGGKFDLVDVTIISNTGTLDLEFDVDAADNDGDTTSGVIGITVDGSTDVLAGTTGNDAIVGDGSAQEIEDLAGNDIIIGGDGADTINLANDGDTDVLVYNALSEAGDVVMGFDTDAPVIGGSGGDVIDIAGLLDRDTDFTGITLAEAQNQGYVDLLQNGDHAEIRVDVNGGGDSYSVLVATLINTQATELNNSNIVVD